MGIIWRRRPFLSRVAVLLLLFLIVFSGTPLCFTPAYTASASSWAGWEGINTIAILPSSDEFLDTAAQELKTYLEKMSGWSWTIAQGDIAGPAIRLDVNPGAPEFADRNDEAVRIIADDSGISIIGKTPIATRHGAYILLEKLGVRWFFKHPAWEVVPSYLQDLGALDEIHEPTFIWRRIWHPVSEGMDRTWEWRRRNRLGGAADYTVKHSYREIMPESLYDSYPDVYLPENTVPSGTSDWQLKPDHPEVVSHAIEYAREYLSKPLGKIWYTQDTIPFAVAPISPNDGRGWGTYGEQGSQFLTDKVVSLTNEIAKAIASEFPGKFAGVYNYSVYAEVPSFNVEPNVMVEITTAYDITELTDVERIRGLQARGAMVGAYDYYDPWVWMKEDVPYWSEKIWNRLKLFAAEGVKTYTAEGGDSWGSAGATYYVASKLAWNPNLVVDEILADFYTKAFGPAAGPMSSYYERWFGGQRVNDNSLALAFRDLWKAQQLAAGHPEILERIRHIQYYMRYRWLSSHVDMMSLEECKDFYSYVTKLKNLYVLYYTYAEKSLRNELKNNRGLSDEEIDALYDDTPPTEAQANAWMDEALTYFEDVNAVDADYINPTNMPLVPLGNQTLPKLEHASAEKATVIIDAQAGDVIELMLKTFSPYNATTFKWYGPDGNLLESIEMPASSSWQTANVTAPVTGRYKLSGNGSIDVINHPAGLIDGLFHASEFYLYVPEGTRGLLLEFDPGTHSSSLYDPTGALAFTIAGGNEAVISRGVANPEPGVWRLSYGGSEHTTSGFQIYGIPDLIWHDPEYLLVPSNNPPVANDQSLTTNADTPINIIVNASDPDQDPLTYTIITGPFHGTLSGNPPSLTYSPDSNFNGLDSFVFVVSDGATTSKLATVTILSLIHI